MVENRLTVKPQSTSKLIFISQFQSLHNW